LENQSGKPIWFSSTIYWVIYYCCWK